MGGMETVQTLIIGAGQAGLATAHELARHGHSCVVLERNNAVGDGWRQRYDSLRLFSPAFYDGLPGLRFPGSPWAFPTKDEVADYLEDYAVHFDLPVRTGVSVDRLSRSDGDFVASTPAGEFHGSNVVVATGGLGRAPRLPDFAPQLDPAILQLHSSEYRRPSQLADGPALVVGASHSGCDIAFELATGRPTTLVGRDHGQIPLRWGTPAFYASGVLLVFAARHVLTRRTPLGRKVMPHARSGGAPMGRIKREDLAARGVVRITERVEGVRDGHALLTDGTVVDAANVIWATGFQQRFDWIELPVTWEDGGYPREYRGVVTEVPGLYFCGLAFQYAFASEVLAGVGRDAAYVADHIRRRSSRVPRLTTTARAATARR